MVPSLSSGYWAKTMTECVVCETHEANVVCGICQDNVCDDDAADCDFCGEVVCINCGKWVCTFGGVKWEMPAEYQWSCLSCTGGEP